MVRLFLLGSFELETPEHGPITLRRKDRALLAYLMIQPQAHTRRALMSVFCDRADDPAGALRLMLSRIRRVVGAMALSRGQLDVQWIEREAWVDYARFTAVLGGDLGLRTSDELDEALDLYRDEFLAGMSLADAPNAELWILQERAHCQTLYERGALALIQRLSQERNWETAIARARMLLAHSPLLDAAHERLLSLYLQTAQIDAARAHYAQYRRVLESELALTPSPEVEAVMAGLARREAPRPEPTGESDDRQRHWTGRRSELTQLQACWQQVQRGRGRVVLISGEPGIGKTALIRRFTQQLAISHDLDGVAYESTRHLPYAPWIAVFERILATWSDAERADLPLADREALARLLPHWADRLAQSAPALPPTEGREAVRLYQGLVDVLLRFAATEARLVLIDDLHWADEASVRLFHFAALQARRAPLLLVGTLRGQAMTAVAAMAMDELIRAGAERIDLSGLPTDAVATLTEALWPQLPAASRSDWSARLERATGGNPFFLRALLKDLAARVDEPDRLPVPVGVRDLVQRRLDQIPRGARQLLGALAVIGLPTAPALLAEIVDEPLDVAIAGLEAGWRHGLVQVDEADHHAFAHDLVREAVVEELNPSRRRRWNARTAIALAARTQAGQETETAELVGRIVQHAVAGDEPELIFEWASRAAAYAIRVLAFDDALATLEAMRSAYPRLARTPEEKDRYLLALIQRARLLRGTGRPLSAAEDLLDLIPARLPTAVAPDFRAELRLGLAGMLAWAGRYGEAIEHAEQAVEDFRSAGDLEGVARALEVAGSLHMTVSNNQDGQRMLREALAVYRQLNATDGEAACLDSLAWSALNLGQVTTALEALERALELAERVGDPIRIAQTCTTLAAAWQFFLAVEPMEVYACRARDILETVSLPAGRAMLFEVGVIDLRDGPGAAFPLLERVEQEARSQSDLWLHGWAANRLGRAAYALGRLEEAETWLTLAERLRSDTGERANRVNDLAWLGRTALARGDLDLALERTRRACEELLALREEAWVWETFDVWRARAEACRRAGMVDAAGEAQNLASEAIAYIADQITDQGLRDTFCARVNSGDEWPGLTPRSGTAS